MNSILMLAMLVFGGSQQRHPNYFHRATTYTVSGTITPGPSGSSGYTVTLTPANVATTSKSSDSYTFSNIAPGTYTVTPSASGYTFTPSSRSVTITASNVTGINFTANPPPVSSTTIFDDEFSDASLSSEWYAMNKAGDPTNNELECYTPGQDTLAGGYLNIETALQSISCDVNDSSHSSYNSGMVTMSAFHFTYGTIEFRAKMAGGTGTWPAIWLLGYLCQPTNENWSAAAGNCNWPAPGSDEIDVAEILNSNHNSVNQQIHSNGHNDGCTASTSDTSQNYHVYDLIWAKGSLTWKIDHTTTCTIKQSYVPDTPMFLIINTAVGGAGGGTVNNNTLTTPVNMSVDYVKITQP